MKKALAYLLLLFFLVNTLGYYFIFEIYKYRIRKEIQSRIFSSSAAIRILEIPDPGNNPEFKRVEKREIRYRGSLYDVIKEVKTGRTTVFYCIHDRKEEALLAAMHAVNKNKFLHSLWQHLIKIAVPPVDLALADPCPVNVLFPQLTVTFSSVIQDTWSPPPETF